MEQRKHTESGPRATNHRVRELSPNHILRSQWSGGKNEIWVEEDEDDIHDRRGDRGAPKHHGDHGQHHDYRQQHRHVGERSYSERTSESGAAITTYMLDRQHTILVRRCAKNLGHDHHRTKHMMGSSMNVTSGIIDDQELVALNACGVNTNKDHGSNCMICR